MVSNKFRRRREILQKPKVCKTPPVPPPPLPPPGATGCQGVTGLYSTGEELMIVNGTVRDAHWTIGTPPYVVDKDPYGVWIAGPGGAKWLTPTATTICDASTITDYSLHFWIGKAVNIPDLLIHVRYASDNSCHGLSVNLVEEGYGCLDHWPRHPGQILCHELYVDFDLPTTNLKAGSNLISFRVDNSPDGYTLPSPHGFTCHLECLE
jgi:hypothetical protein